MAAPLPARRLARLVAGTFCPGFQYRASRRHVVAHSQAKSYALREVAQRLKREGYNVLAHSGVTTPEPWVSVVLPGGQLVNGRIDLLVVAERGGSLTIAVVEAKGGLRSALGLDTIMQATIYSLPLFEAATSSSGQVSLARGGGALTVSSSAGRLDAVLSNPLPPPAAGGLGGVLVFTAHQGGIVDVTRIAEALARALLSYHVPHPPSNARVPGPWCLVCSRYGSCDA